MFSESTVRESAPTSKKRDVHQELHGAVDSVEWRRRHASHRKSIFLVDVEVNHVVLMHLDDDVSPRQRCVACFY